VNKAITAMSDTVRRFLTAILLLGVAAHGGGGETNSLLVSEKLGIDKIAQLTAREHSEMLFTLADYAIGYARDGHIQWINSLKYQGGICGWPHPALAHDGLRVAFVSSSDVPRHCRITLHDVSTGTERPLVDHTQGDPGEISWSWDDSEIAFFDHGIQAVSVRDGSKRTLLPPSMLKIGGQEFTYGVWDPIQWLHSGRDLAVEFDTLIPTKQRGTYQQQSNLLLVKDGSARVVDIGSRPAVSPISDRIAYYGRDGVVAVNADETGKSVLAKAPATLFSKEDLFWNIVWSPDGNRLFFGTIVSENRNDKLYLLDVKSGRREQFLTHTSITIRGWH
jgi:dipeptidyl aminopeptidase/acylaminoacyl peptidase